MKVKYFICFLLCWIAYSSKTQTLPDSTFQVWGDTIMRRPCLSLNYGPFISDVPIGREIQFTKYNLIMVDILKDTPKPKIDTYFSRITNLDNIPPGQVKDELFADWVLRLEMFAKDRCYWDIYEHTDTTARIGQYFVSEMATIYTDNKKIVFTTERAFSTVKLRLELQKEKIKYSIDDLENIDGILRRYKTTIKQYFIPLCLQPHI